MPKHGVAYGALIPYIGCLVRKLLSCPPFPGVENLPKICFGGGRRLVVPRSFLHGAVPSGRKAWGISPSSGVGAGPRPRGLFLSDSLNPAFKSDDTPYSALEC